MLLQFNCELPQPGSIDNITSLSACAFLAKTNIFSVKVSTGDTRYHDILNKFPEITRPSGKPMFPKHDTVHYIKTAPGPSVFCILRRLAPEVLKITKREFELMLSNGTARLSDSPGLLPFTWRPRRIVIYIDRQYQIDIHLDTYTIFPTL